MNASRNWRRRYACETGRLPGPPNPDVPCSASVTIAWNPYRTIPATVGTNRRVFDANFPCKGPEFIAVGFLGLVGGVTMTAFGPPWLRRLLLPQIVDSTQRKVAKLEQEVEELKPKSPTGAKAANADLARDKETFPAHDRDRNPARIEEAGNYPRPALRRCRTRQGTACRRVDKK